MRPLLLTPAVLLLLAACGSVTTDVGEGPTAEDLVGGWELVEGQVDGSAIPAPAGARATLVVEDESLGGTAFCNGYGGDYRLAGGGLAVSGLAQTEMGCEPAVMAAEEAFLAALQAADDRAAVEDGQLVLAGDGVELRFRSLPPVPQEELVGTEWVLTTLLRDGTAASVAGEPAVLRLADDGTFRGSTGCRRLSGTWTTSGDEVLFPTMSAEGDCDPELRDQDDHVVRVLGDGFQAREEGGTLTIEDPDGWGLVYEASPARQSQVSQGE